MEENNRYYTPESAEEIINFILSEYYIYTLLGANLEQLKEPAKIVFDSEDLVSYLAWFITENNEKWNYASEGRFHYNILVDIYLIPYLTKEDIEDLGFVLKPIIMGEDTNPDELGIYENNVIQGSFYPNADGIEYPNIELFNTVFFVRNRAELRKLMKQVSLI